MVKIVALVLFLLTYVLLLSLPKIRAWIALTTACIFILLTFIPDFSVLMPITQVFGAIDWNVLMMIAGTMIVVDLFIDSKMPSVLANVIIKKTPNVKWAVIAMAVFAGVISAFIDNVATVLIVAPIAISISKKLEISPVPSVIAIAVFSNLEGAATLVGDTTSIMLGGYADWNFLDFFWLEGRPGPFFIIQVGLVAATVVLALILRKLTQPIELNEEVKAESYVPTILLCGIIVTLIIVSFIPSGSKPAVANGIVTMAYAIIGLIYVTIKNKSFKNAGEILKNFDYFTIVLLASLFVIIAGITNVGVIEDIADLIVKIGGTNPFVVYTIIVFFSMLVSAFIDNIPYVLTMLPVMGSLAAGTGAPLTLLLLGLIIGATLGGNLTPIGASANIAGIGILRKEGHEVKLKEYLRIGVPVTLAAVVAGYIVTWFLFS